MERLHIKGRQAGSDCAPPDQGNEIRISGANDEVGWRILDGGLDGLMNCIGEEQQSKFNLIIG